MAAQTDGCRDGFRMYLEDTMMTNDSLTNETSDGVQDLSRDMSMKKNEKETVTALLDHFKYVKNEIEESFDKERLNMEDIFENEKSDIVKGFIIEKDILAKQHEKEKQNLITNFIGEREKMLQNFQSQVKEIESKMKIHHSSFDVSLSTEAKENTSKTKLLNDNYFKAVEQYDTADQVNSKLLIKVGEKDLVSAEEFIKTLEIEEKFETEKDNIENSFKEEKEKLKTKIEYECEKKLKKEKKKYENKVHELVRDIDQLKQINKEGEDMWKIQASRLEQQFQNERLDIDARFKEEKSNLRRKLEEKNSLKLMSQQDDYDRSISELKTELRKIKKDFEFVKDENCSKENTIKLKNEITQQLKENFDHETRVIREQNEKLNIDLKQLTTEKYDLQRKVRELESSNDNDSALLKEYTEKVNKEYEYKLKRLISQCEKLKIDLVNSEKETKELERQLATYETCEKNMEGRLNITEQTVKQCEDTINTMRSENTNLSHEINLLRCEKDDLGKHLERQQNNERQIKINTKRVESEFEDLSNRFIILEREKLQQEKLISNVRKELEATGNLSKERSIKIENFEKELQRQRQLLDGETKENRRLHERFNQDADLLRKKDIENSNMRTLLENIKIEFETLKTKIQSDNEKILSIQSEKDSLLNQIEKNKKTENLQKKHEIITVQNSYVKEFAKRLEFVKSNYEREITSLKKQIEDLKNLKSENKIIEDNIKDQKNLQGYCEVDDQMKTFKGKVHINVVASSFQDLPTRDMGPSDNTDSCTPIITLPELPNTRNIKPHYSACSPDNSSQQSSSLKLPSNQLSNASLKSSSQQNTFQTGIYENIQPVPMVKNLQSVQPNAYNHTNQAINRKNQETKYDNSNNTYNDKETEEKSNPVLKRIYTYMNHSSEFPESVIDSEQTTSSNGSYSEPLSPNIALSPTSSNNSRKATSSTYYDDIKSCAYRTKKLSPRRHDRQTSSSRHNQSSKRDERNQYLTGNDEKESTCSAPSIDSGIINSETKKLSPRRHNQQTSSSRHNQSSKRDERNQYLTGNDEKESTYSAPSIDSGVINSDRSSLKCPSLPSESKQRDTQNRGNSDDVIDIFARLHMAEKQSDNDELRKLLTDVRKEVLLLNKMMDERTPNSTPRQSITPDSSYSNHSVQMKNSFKKNTCSSEDSEEIQRLNEENETLKRRLDEQEERMEHQEITFEELYKRRVLLEKLVERLQSRLREETCKRRQIEQSKNFIPEDSKEELDDSTV